MRIVVALWAFGEEEERRSAAAAGGRCKASRTQWRGLLAAAVRRLGTSYWPEVVEVFEMRKTTRRPGIGSCVRFAAQAGRRSDLAGGEF